MVRFPLLKVAEQSCSSCGGPAHHINKSPPGLVFVPPSPGAVRAAWGTWSSLCSCSQESWAPSWASIPAHITAALPLQSSNLTCKVIFFFFFFKLFRALWAWPFPKACSVRVLSLVGLFGGCEISCYKPVLQRSCVSERQAGNLLTTLLVILVLILVLKFAFSTHWSFLLQQLISFLTHFSLHP